MRVSPHEFFEPAELSAAPAEIVKLAIHNPNLAYLRATRPGRIEQIQGQESVMDWVSKMNFPNWRHQRKRQAAYMREQEGLDGENSLANGDQASRERFFGVGGWLGSDALRLWRETIPRAVALLPLLNPFNTWVIRHPDPRDGREAAMQQGDQEWMAACTDGQEIFHRSTILVEEMGGHIGKYAAAHPDEKIAVVSVGGGTALGTMQAIQCSGVDPARVELVLLESDKSLLASDPGDRRGRNMIEQLADRIGYTGKITPRETDAFDPEAMRQVKEELAARGNKVVALDAVGIAEYSNKELGTPDRRRRYGDDYMLFNPEKFMKACLNLVDDEGIALIGQMRADRPNPYFMAGVVSWPLVCRRSIREFARVLRDGGSRMDLTRFSLTPLDTYTMATIFKSEQAAAIAGFTGNESTVEPSPAAETSSRGLLHLVRAAAHAGHSALHAILHRPAVVK